ncbi:hypothetical protein [Corynebacterium sp. CCM 9203]|uniref:hypothetical protein n=1 Tax=Corynebacterium sp. CCM 9203 TaxID=3057615 RepID=UPI0035262F08
MNAVFDAHRDGPWVRASGPCRGVRRNGEAMSDRAAWPIAFSSGWFSVFGTPRQNTSHAGMVGQCTTTSVL